MAGSRNSRLSRIFEISIAGLLLVACSLAALTWFLHHGHLLYYGDAEAHLNIARRIVDSRTPGAYQIGTVWLPLPHWLMLPFIGQDALWASGLAGSIPAAVAFVAAGLFLFAAVRLLFDHSTPAFAALALFAWNPNVLYLQATAMTEALMFASLFGLFYCMVLFRRNSTPWAAAGAGLAALAGSLTRYEAWFLIPFVAAYFLLTAKRSRWIATLLFAAIASAGPAYWLAHNWWFFGDAFEFYRGPWSAKAIYARSMAAGMQPYPGDGDWLKAGRYFLSAVRLCAGWPLAMLGAAGVLACLWKRRLWPAVLFSLPPLFYTLSIYSSGTPIFVPHLWPYSYYNTRYGLAALPLLVLGGATLAALPTIRFRKVLTLGVVALAVSPWLLPPNREAWICWKESEVNSAARRVWTREAAEYLQANYRGGGIATSFPDLVGIYRTAGIPIKEILYEDNRPYWQAAVQRPDLFLKEEWAVTFSGDRMSTAILRAQRTGPRYLLMKRITAKGAPVVEIYRRN